MVALSLSPNVAQPAQDTIGGPKQSRAGGAAAGKDLMLPFATYLGGSRDEVVNAVATDDDGNTYLAGWTNSQDFPLQDPIQGDYSGPQEGCLFYSTRPCGDAFVVKIDRSRRLALSTYLGGPGGDYAADIAVDKTGALYVAGAAGPGFPVINAVQPAHGGGSCGQGRRQEACSDAFVAKIDPDGKRLLFSTYLGGAAADGASALALDGSGNVHIAGFAGPGLASANAVREFGGGQCGEASAKRPCSDAFAAKMSADGARLSYATFVGGPGEDIGAGIALDRRGSAYLTGSTRGGFPVGRALQAEAGGGNCVVTALPLTQMPCRDAFVAGLGPTGVIEHAGYLGGKGDDEGRAIAVDPSGAVYVTGSAGPGFPLKRAARAAHAGGNCPVARDPALPRPCSDAFVSRLEPGLESIAYATYLGGEGADSGDALAPDNRGVIVAGSSGGGRLGGTSRRFGGKTDALVARLDTAGSLLQATYLGGSGRDAATALEFDRSGGVRLAGGTDSRSDFPTAEPLQESGGGQVDGFLAGIEFSSTRLPYIEQVIPGSGSVRGGTPVTIKGRRLPKRATVHFGNRAVPGRPGNSDGTRLRATAPPSEAARVPVGVTGPAGRSGPAPGAAFTYGEGEWRSIPGPTLHHHTATALPGGKVLIAGGCARVDSSSGCPAGKASRRVLLFDPSDDSWEEAGRLRKGRWSHSAVFVPEGPQTACGNACGKVVLLGGFERRLTAEVFDPSTGKSTMLPPTADPRMGPGHTATLLGRGPVSVCGQNCGKLLLTVRSHSFTTAGELLDLPRRKWTRVGRTPEPATGNDPSRTLETARGPTRLEHTASALPDGRVLIIGGASLGATPTEGPRAPAELFDPVTATFLPAPDSPTYRYAGHFATRLRGGDVLVTGGLTDNIGTLTSTVEAFTPATRFAGSAGSWQPRPSLPRTPRSGHVAVAMRDGKVLVVGGSDSIGEPRGDGQTGSGLSTAELYDPHSRRWTSAGTLQNRREAMVLFQGLTTLVSPAFTVTALRDGRILVVGGGPGSPETYHPAGVVPASEDHGRPPGTIAPWMVGALLGAVLALAAILVSFRLSRDRSGPAEVQGSPEG